MFGGLPGVLHYSEPEDKVVYLQNLFTEIYFKDIIERYKITLPDVLEQITDELSSSIGSQTNANRLANALSSARRTNVNSNTVSSYLGYLCDSFLFSCAKRYDVKGKRYFSYPSKYYCVDLGLRNARLNFRQQEESHIMENIIFNTLISRGFAVDVGVVPVNVKGDDQKIHQSYLEIDFIINKGMKKYYIQSALRMDTPDTKQQEERPLLELDDFFRKIIISKTKMKPWVNEKGVITIGLMDFLLDESALDAL